MNSYKGYTIISALLLLPILIVLSMDAGISGDEYLHLNQAEAVTDYIITMGEDDRALDTPVTNLKYYGQSFDNCASIIARIFNIEDIFTLRHIMNAVAGWTIIIFVILLAKKIGGWKTALTALILITASPRFIGHSLNNLKDIPFALGYIAGITGLSYWIIEWPNQKKRTAILLAASFAFAFSIRPPGLIIIAYLGIITTLLTIITLLYKKEQISKLTHVWAKFALITVTGYAGGLILWPFAWQNPIINPIASHFLMEAYPVTIRQLFFGELIWSDLLPRWYLPYMIFITTPLIVTAGVAAAFLTEIRPQIFKADKKKRVIVALLTFTILFPLTYIAIKGANVYGGWRHVLFIYPPMVILAAYGIKKVFDIPLLKKRGWIATLLLITTLASPVKFMAKNHPYHYLWFNSTTGGYKKIFGKHEADYYFHTVREGAEWLDKYLKLKSEEENRSNGEYIIASNFDVSWFFRNSTEAEKTTHTSFYNRSFNEWDYAVFTASYLHSHTINNYWPPKGTIHTVNVDGKPVTAVVKRVSSKDFKGWEALTRGEPQKAAKLLKQAVCKNSTLEGAWLNYARALIRCNKDDKAKKALYKSLEINPYNEAALAEKAKWYFNKGDIEKAILITEKIISKNPKYLSAYILMADYRLINKDTIKAKEILKESLKYQPSYKEAIEKLNKLR
ncbi:tetratricopeptide repeat protein [Marinilabiliaceae bacterium ANBcel2]|nr:tetratricopeptide repeat protein [Marinilabiliaceae bacterium ANBcel2]